MFTSREQIWEGKTWQQTAAANLHNLLKERERKKTCNDIFPLSFSPDGRKSFETHSRNWKRSHLGGYSAYAYPATTKCLHLYSYFCFFCLLSNSKLTLTRADTRKYFHCALAGYRSVIRFGSLRCYISTSLLMINKFLPLRGNVDSDQLLASSSVSIW